MLKSRGDSSLDEWQADKISLLLEIFKLSSLDEEEFEKIEKKLIAFENKEEDIDFLEDLMCMVENDCSDFVDKLDEQYDIK